MSNKETKSTIKEKTTEYKYKIISDRSVMSTTANEVKYMINFLTSERSCIYDDDISVDLLRTCPHYIRLPASYLRDQSNTEGTFPKRLRYSKVKTLPCKW
jgi:hypothetical protein